MPFLPALLLVALSVHDAPRASQTGQTPTAREATSKKDIPEKEIAARGHGSILTFDELDQVLMLRYALSEAAREAIKHLVEAELLMVLAREQHLEISARQIEARWSEIDTEISRSDPGGLRAYLQRSGVDPVEFREHLKLALIHETLARRALRIPANRPITGEQQVQWLNAEMSKRELERVAPPFAGGVVAHCAGVEISVDEFIEELRTSLPDDDISKACYHSLLLKRILERLPDLASEALDAAIETELNRRRVEAKANPEYQGASYEQVLRSQGFLADRIREDPSVRIAALANIWVDRKFTQDELREVYEKKRAHYDGLFGEAIETHVIFLRGAEFKNDLNPRTFAEAEREMIKFSEGIIGFASFQLEAKGRSEDRATRDKAGFWGWITRGSRKVPESARKEIFDALDSGRYDPNAPRDNVSTRLVGPVRSSAGALLMWLGQRRPAPTWDEMKKNVHTDLRREFLEELLTRESVTNWRQKP